MPYCQSLTRKGQNKICVKHGRFWDVIPPIIRWWANNTSTMHYGQLILTLNHAMSKQHVTYLEQGAHRARCCRNWPWYNRPCPTVTAHARTPRHALFRVAMYRSGKSNRCQGWHAARRRFFRHTTCTCGLMYTTVVNLICYSTAVLLQVRAWNSGHQFVWICGPPVDRLIDCVFR